MPRPRRDSPDIKLNCVIQRGVNEDECLPLAEFARARGHTLRFIEYMDVGTCNGWRAERVVPSVNRAISSMRGGRCSRWIRIIAAKSRVAIVSKTAAARSVSSVRFRRRSAAIVIARASPRTVGSTPVCSRPKAPICGRGLAQGDDAFAQSLAEAWRARADRYSELRAAARETSPDARKRVEMFLVGG